MIFVDDYFNCLTVGTIMSPITDKHKVSRAKLAYIIDSTAAPVCILAPVSSWAAAVSSSLPKDSTMDGFMLFIRSIPFNYYAIFTLFMVLFIVIKDFDFGKMKKLEEKNSDLIVVETTTMEIEKKGNGRVSDLIIPIITLIVFCVAAMLYTGGILEGANFVTAFANCDSAFSLVMGSFFTMIAIAILYLPRKIITFKQFTDSLSEGFIAMVPAILILTFAWTLSGICGSDHLKIGEFVSGIIRESSISHGVIPAIFFLIAMGLSFSTGTSWGTFGILLPIVFAIFSGEMSQLLIISMSAVMAGAVCGDHVSPISDTTILSSTGAGCNHIDHVNTQLPYALVAAGVSFVCYIVSGFMGNGYVGLVVGIVGMFTILSIINHRQKKQQ
ncbi:MAG TPA: Na+/H+ antiporter NhaC family protein [Lachnospiraceae bacterium]|nr:Na+/H+ antiporter NhaC family protein [Lachnospiraceae bacterium]